jgi:ketosteroid isomerase-like protein
MRINNGNDPRVNQALELLRSLLQGQEMPLDSLTPWEESHFPGPLTGGRISATDRLSWWFRPHSEGRDPWENFFSWPQDNIPPNPIGNTFSSADRPAFNSIAMSDPGVNHATSLGSRAGLRLILTEPEEEIIEHDSQAVVTCLYRFIHAVGRGELDQAMECIDEDYHTLDKDVEIDKLGLSHQLKSLLDSLIGWGYVISLVEIPRPILHPDGILVYAEILIDATKPEDGSKRTILEKRIAVFNQQSNGDWLIISLSPV